MKKAVVAKHTARVFDGKFHRRRLLKSEQAILHAEYAKSVEWEPSKMKELAERIGCPKIKVLKWNYDQRRKNKL